MGSVEGFCGYQARGISIRGKFVLSRNTGYKTRGVAIWLNVLGENSFYLAPGDSTRPVPGAPSGTPRENQAKLRDGTVWGL